MHHAQTCIPIDRPDPLDPLDHAPTTHAIAHAIEDIALALMAALDGGRQDEADTIAGGLGPQAIRMAQYCAAERIASDESPVSPRRIMLIAGIIAGKRTRASAVARSASDQQPLMIVGQGDYRREMFDAGWRAAPEVRA